MKNRLERLRRERGLSQQELAEMAGTTAQQISRLERGERQLTLAWIERLAGALQCEPSDFIQDTESAQIADLARRLNAIEDLLLRICHHFGVDT